MLSVVETKAVALVVMVVLTLVVSLLPLYIHKLLLSKIHQGKSQLILAGCLCFGAGVLLSIVFVHLLPETRETYEAAMNDGLMTRTSFPVAEVILCAGFFLVYLLEEIVHTWIDHRQQHKVEEVKEMEVIHTDAKTFEEAKKEAQHKRISESMSSRLSESRQSTSSHTAVRSVAVTNEAFEDDDPLNKGLEMEAPRHSVHNIPHQHQAAPIDSSTSVTGAIVVVVALSFHGIMEGLAVGLEDSVTGVWILFGALTAHKLVIGFSMAMELLEVGVSLKPFLVSMIIFSLASPIGCLIGSLVLSASPQETAVGILLPNVLQSIAGGTILYVTFCEVLERERTKTTGGWVRFFALVLGFSVMVALQILEEEEEEETNPTTPGTTDLPLTTITW